MCFQNFWMEFANARTHLAKPSCSSEQQDASGSLLRRMKKISPDREGLGTPFQNDGASTTNLCHRRANDLNDLFSPDLRSGWGFSRRPKIKWNCAPLFLAKKR